MDSSNTAVAGTEPGGMSEPGRLLGIFWGPKAVFADLAQRPRWIVPLVLNILVSVALLVSFSQQVGWRTFLERQLAHNSRMQQLSAEQRERILDQQAGITGIAANVAGVVGSIVSLLAVAGVLLLLFKMSGGSELKYKQAMAIVSYSWIPFILYGLLMLVVLYINPRDFNLTAPLPFRLGWFLDPTDTPTWLMSLGNAVDLFTFWAMALIAFGFSVAARRIGFGKAFGVVFSAWLVMVLVGAGWAAIFG